MSRPPKKSGVDRPKPAYEDRKLWDEWAKSISPIRNQKNRIPLSGTRDNQDDQTSSPNPFPDIDQSAPDKSHPLKQTLRPPADKTSKDKPAGSYAHQQRSSPTHRVPQLSNFDKKSRRRLGAGQIEIAARIDLHGMRQHEAHDALRGFLNSAHARGLRWVLVITGKGAPTRHGHDYDHEHDTSSFRGLQSRGVLRREVPQWLTEPELRAIVVSHTTAAQHHGGEGARYVQLRSKRRT